MGFCEHKMKLEACYVHSRVVMSVVEQSGSEQKARSTVYARSGLHYACNRHITHIVKVLRG